MSSGLYLTGLFVLVVPGVVIDRYRNRKKRYNLNLDEQEIGLLKALIVADTIGLSTVEVKYYFEYQPLNVFEIPVR